MNEVKEIKISNQSNISVVFWFAGFLFTVGIGAIPVEQMAELLWHQKVIISVAGFFFWPAILGAYFGGL